ncbi:MAG: PASTA domain-containing protein [Treponema sp.]|nr:PASTA domain-containing protein [Treponema sp.]
MERRHLRYWTAIALLAAFAAIVTARYAKLASEGPSPASAKPPEVVRGSILDRNGRPLAVDTNLYNIAVWRPELDKELWTEDAAELERLLELEPGSVRRTVETSRADFMYAVKRIPASRALEVQELKRRRGLSGFIVEKVHGRLYPERTLASHVVGFVGNDHYGLGGIEAKYENELAPRAAAGENGGIVYGNQVILTLDADAQYLLERIARKAWQDNGAEAVMLLAQRASTGEILAYVSMPDFDPNDFLAYPETAWSDRPALYAYEPGSVFKVFSMAGIMELGAIDERSAFYCDGAYERVVSPEETIRIRCLGNHGRVTVTEILKYSCNSGAGQASDTVSALDFYDILREFGFGMRTGLPLPGESPGSLRDPKTWSLRSKPTIAMGQELLVTAAQMTAAAGAIANGGVLMKPRLVSRVLAPDGSTVSEEPAQPVRRVLSPETARKILTAMEAAAGEAGTGRRAAVSGVRLAVKTGTAQMIDPGTGRYSDKDFIASCLGIFPADAPEIVLYLAIVKPRGESTFGGRIAAPVIGEAADSLITLYGLARGSTPTLSHSGRIVLTKPAPVQIGPTMPDLIGTPKRLLLPLLTRTDLELSIEGDGYVVSQDPPPGTPVHPGAKIRLVLE